MLRRFASSKKAVEIDECGKCGGVWLDAGELTTIRSEFSSEDERKAAAAKDFDQIFSQDLAKARATSEAELEKSRRIAHALRWICPSYYIPGKQKGGAF